MPINSNLKIAIVHDWLVSDRGGEKILKALLDCFPTADLFCLFHSPGAVPSVEQRLKYVSHLNRLPFVHRYYRHLLPLLPLAAESIPLTHYDLILSSSHCVAKGIIPGPQSVHICYCHTPMRYAWDRFEDYFGNSLKRYLVSPLFNYLRQWDVSSSSRVDHFIANSQWTAKRIQKYYRRDSEVIYPFVEIENFSPSFSEPKSYYLIVSGFAPYKKIDLAIQTCQALGRELWIAGEGQESKHLAQIAKQTTRFLGRVSTAELKQLYANCRALLFPGEEDFGITPLECMASGRPVIAYERGGLKETVIDGSTGIFFKEQNVSCLTDAILRFEKIETLFDAHMLHDHAASFSKQAFKSALLAAVEAQLNGL